MMNQGDVTDWPVPFVGQAFPLVGDRFGSGHPRQAVSDEIWADLIARQPRGGVYGVSSTGIYCRYGCVARHPLRRNVRGFDNAAEALAAGFRACKRCQPG